MHVHIATYISKAEEHFFLYFIHSKNKYGVIVQNGDHTLKIHIWSVYNMTIESTPVE